ncbi:MAG: hypothetical protein KGQ60_08325, partial [Planctomycetes bacterium]|nr:hypothetical protein [Planctomycetota bacterium]
PPLVKDRMERSLMRWTLEGARNMLNLQAVFQCDRWSTFLNRNIEAELQESSPTPNCLGIRNLQPCSTFQSNEFHGMSRKVLLNWASKTQD